MAVDRSRLAAALAYKQAEEQRRRQLLESVPLPADAVAGETPRQTDFGTNLENLSIGLGRGLQSQLQGIKGIVTDPVGSARSVYQAGKAVVRDPAIVAQMLREMGQKATSGPLGAGEVIGEMIGPRKTGPVMAELDVYHGTPHRFPATEANPLGEFDASKIGTGEGAQAYGHGIYLAEAPGTAEIYKRALAEDVVAVDGNRIAAKRSVDARRDPESIAVNALISAQSGQVDDPFATAMRRLGGKYGPRNEYDAKAIEVIRNWRNKGAKIEEGGVMYKADLPDEMIDRMLDWDKPLSEQPALVKQLEAGGFLKQAPAPFSNRYVGPTGTLIDLDSPGGNLVMGGGWNQKTSAALRDAGIPGIKYKDAGSRGQGGSGTRNFVVFPGEEKKVRILERK